MKYNYIAFDIDGTLIDTQGTFTHSLALTIKQIKGEDVPPGELVRYFGVPSRTAAESVGFEDVPAALEIWERHYRALAREQSRPFDGVHQVLEDLAAAGVRMGVVTSRNREEYSLDANLDPWRDFFEIVICADDTVRHKPEPEPALAFASAAGVHAGECLYVGDTLADALCARGAGMDFALADWYGAAPADIPATWRIDSVARLLFLAGVRPRKGEQ